MLDELIAEAGTFYRGVLDGARFRDAPRLLDEFERDAATWGKRRGAKSANGVQEKLMLAAGAALLSTMGHVAKTGLFETKASIANKISRGTFSATFPPASLKAIGCQNIRVEDQ
jgi:hypothetical protein